MDYHEVQEILGNEAESLHGFNSPKISKDLLHKPSSCSIEQIFALSNRNLQVQVLTYPAKYDHVRQSQGWPAERA